MRYGIHAIRVYIMEDGHEELAGYSPIELSMLFNNIFKSADINIIIVVEVGLVVL